MVMSPDTQKTIPFSPPDITEKEIEAVAAVLRSGWITTGSKTKDFERFLREFTQADAVACLSSATAALECALRVLGIGPGDEVITSAYTYTASCSVICHVGATPVLCDTAPDSYEMDYDALDALITEHTKAIIPVDIAGKMCDYDLIERVLIARQSVFRPNSKLQDCLGRIAIIADAAHSLGASYHDRPSGSIADFTAFSFHAVKNVTTAEGGALAWNTERIGFSSDKIYQEMMLLSLHGQTKDALSKSDASSWEYDVAFPGWKCNMTDIQAALGLVQMERYPTLLERRRKMVANYEMGLKDINVSVLAHQGNDFSSSCHLMLVRLLGKDEIFRNAVISRMAKDGISTNVHYKPLPLLTAYRDRGFDIANYPNAYQQYRNEITLPLHTLLKDDDIEYVVDSLKRAYNSEQELH